MADLLPVKVEGVEDVSAKLAGAPPKVKQAVRRAIEESAIRVTAGAKAKLTDDVLRVRTGRLRRSVHYVMGGSDDAPQAAIGTNLEYAGIHEFGGQTRAHVIEALNAKALMFQVGGQVVFAKRVNHPGSKIPERSYLRSTLGEQSSEIKARIDEAVGGALP